MHITACRLTRSKYASDAMSGLGSMYSDGRWHRRGSQVVYASEHPALALLEIMVHVGSMDLLSSDYVVIPLRLESSIVEFLNRDDLPHGWSAWPWPPSTKGMGTLWVQEQRSAVLQVPSAVVPNHVNFVINPAHPDATLIQIGEAQPFPIDPRLENS